MATFQHLAGSVLSTFWRIGAPRLQSRSQILMYHSIGGVADNDTKGLYSVSKENFYRQMEHLKKLQESRLLLVVPFGSERPGTISITFDDGYADNFEVAAPILRQFGFPFHIFINPQLVTSRQGGFLTHQQISELATSQNVTLGIHGYSHLPLTDFSNERLLSELMLAINWIQDFNTEAPITMSYPHGAVDSRIVDAMRSLGITRAACSKFSPLSTNSDPLLLPRIDIWSTDTLSVFDSKIRGYWDWMRWRT